MAVTVNIPTPLRKLTNNESEVSVEAGSVGDSGRRARCGLQRYCRKALGRKGRYPALCQRIRK